MSKKNKHELLPDTMIQDSLLLPVRIQIAVCEHVLKRYKHIHSQIILNRLYGRHRYKMISLHM